MNQKGTRPIFTSQALIRIKEDLRGGRGVKKYLNEKFSVLPGDTVESLAKVAAKAVSLSIPSGGKGDSAENAIKLFEAYDSLTPEDASDERFWAYLTHVDFFDYMKKRTDILAQKEEKRGKYILDHWFVDPVSPASLMNNDISRLWWVVFLTKTKNVGDPYSLTREVFSMLDYTTHLLPGTQGRNETIRLAVLEFVVENPALFSKNKEAKVRLIMRKLNLRGGYSALSYLDSSQIKLLLKEITPELKRVK
jgi:hypothetical protein